jgi:hypothetical protein
MWRKEREKWKMRKKMEERPKKSKRNGSKVNKSMYEMGAIKVIRVRE